MAKKDNDSLVSSDCKGLCDVNDNDLISGHMVDDDELISRCVVLNGLLPDCLSVFLAFISIHHGLLRLQLRLF